MKLVFSILFISSLSLVKAQNKILPAEMPSSPLLLNPTANGEPGGVNAIGLMDPLTLSAQGYDFGNIPYGKQAFTTFNIKNTGKTPLTINNIATSCGCTTPEWEKSPIAPGTSRTVKVGFNGYADGAFSKTVTITYLDNKTQTFVIKGVGIKAPEVSSKPNETVNLLRQSF